MRRYKIIMKGHYYYANQWRCFENRKFKDRARVPDFKGRTTDGSARISRSMQEEIGEAWGGPRQQHAAGGTSGASRSQGSRHAAVLTRAPAVTAWLLTPRALPARPSQPGGPQAPRCSALSPDTRQPPARDRARNIRPPTRALLWWRSGFL